MFAIADGGGRAVAKATPQETPTAKADAHDKAAKDDKAALVATASTGSPVAKGQALGQLDAQTGSRDKTDAQVRAASHVPNPLDLAANLVGDLAHFAGDAAGRIGDAGHDAIESSAKRLGPAASVAADVVEAGGDLGRAILNAGGDVAKETAKAGVIETAVSIGQTVTVQEARIAAGAAAHAGDPAGFVDWLAGPDAPAFEDVTAAVPGLQQGIGDLIDGAMQNPLISGGIGVAFGFQYVPEGDFYTTNTHSIQSQLGFHDGYDTVGKLLGMDIDDKVMQFSANGVDYRVELWKGGYGAGGAYGGEIGLYTNGAGDRGALGDALEQIPGYYSSANGDNRIRMTQTIYNKNDPSEVYFTNDGKGADPDGKHYWNLAIRTDPGVRHEDLGQRGTLEMTDPVAAQKLVEEINRQGAAMAQAGEGDLSATLGADGRTVSFVWE